MKKWMSLALAMLMLLMFCACEKAPESPYQGSKEELDTLLMSIANIPVGTMGVSMTITARAVELLQWCESTDMSGEELALATKTFYDTIEPEMQEIFLEQVAVVVNGVAVLSKEETRSNMLETAGLDKNLKWEDTVVSKAACLDDQL